MIDEEIRKEILREYYRGIKVADIAKEHNISLKSVYRIVNEQRSMRGDGG